MESAGPPTLQVGVKGQVGLTGEGGVPALLPPPAQPLLSLPPTFSTAGVGSQTTQGWWPPAGRVRGFGAPPS